MFGWVYCDAVRVGGVVIVLLRSLFFFFRCLYVFGVYCVCSLLLVFVVLFIVDVFDCMWFCIFGLRLRFVWFC